MPWHFVNVLSQESEQQEKRNKTDTTEFHSEFYVINFIFFGSLLSFHKNIKNNKKKRSEMTSEMNGADYKG